MRIKRVLLLAPLLLLAFLLQSYLWVPTYEDQTAASPERLRTLIVGRIGDAKILNPALNADGASSEVVSYVFGTLLELDERLELRGNLAESWEIRERVLVAARPERTLPDGRPATAENLVAAFRAARREGRLDPELDALVEGVRRLPPERRESEESLPEPGAEEGAEPVPVTVTVEVPERVEFSLARVEPAFPDRLAPLLGGGYGEDFAVAERVSVSEVWAEELLRPTFAERLPVFGQHPVIVFRLRRGVRFHDGHEFDSGDVAFTWRAIMDPKNLSPRTPDFEPIQEIETPDRHTVRVVYSRLFSPAIYSWTYMGILPEHLLDEEALRREAEARGLSEEARASFGMRDSAFNRSPVGTGRFRFVEWRGDEYIHLAAFEDHWDGPPEAKEVYIRIIPDMLTQEVEFRTGAVDQYTALPHQAARYREDERYLALSTVGSGYSYIGYNVRRPPFDDPRVRRALSMAIDVDQIIEYILFGEGDRVTGPYPINTPWYDPGVEPVPHDPEGALRILRELGWERNAEGWLERDGEVFSFALITNQGNPIRQNIMTIAQDAWKKIGIRCQTQIFEWAVFLEDFVNQGEFDAVVLGWSMGIDPDLFQIWHSSQTGPYQLNFVGYRDPEIDRLIAAIRREYDPARQEELAHALHRKIAADQPYTFLFSQRGTVVLDRKLVVVEEGPQGEDRYRRPYVTEKGMLGDYRHRLRKLPEAPVYDAAGWVQ